jgi:outer membrane receptor for ferrienterochelin and colicin
MADTNQDELMKSLLSKDLAALGKLEIYTTSRSATRAEDTLGVVTIITAEDIARKGYNSVQEVMQEVPGIYYNNSAAFENLTSRGISQTLTSFLFLIDGHAVNNKSAFGISVETVFPILADVERIEVVRGPGTVLWGGEAGLGIIHVITKSGSSIDESGEGKWETYADYMTDHNRRVISTIYGKKYDKGDLMTSFKYFDSGSPDGARFAPGSSGPKAVIRRNFNFDFDASYEFNLKANWKDFNVRGAITNFNNINHDNSQRTEANYYRSWLELGHAKEVNDRTQIKSRLFFNNFETTYFHTKDVYNDNFKMMGFGGETLLHYTEDNYHLTGGLYLEGNYLEFLSGFDGGLENQFEGAPSTFDTQVAIFSDWVYTGISNWQLDMGGRLQVSNGVLGEEIYFMPRVGVLHEINSQWTAKYLFNSSTVRPTLNTLTGGEGGTTTFQNGADEPQKFDVHDLQLAYKNDTTTITTTLFYVEVKDMIIFVGTGGKRFDNLADATSKGIQLEFTHKLSKAKTYGDYTFALAKFDKRNVTADSGTVLDLVSRGLANESLRLAGTPKHQWNIGLDMKMRPNMTLNFHHRGYAEIFTEWSDGTEFRDLPAAIFFDSSLHWKDAGMKGLGTTLYIKNILDADPDTPDTVNGGYTENILNRRVGINLKYSF